MKLTFAFFSVVFGITCHADPVTAKPEPKPHPLVTYQTGDLPIILTAPHGGRADVPGVPPREGKGVPRFVAKSDAETDRLTEALADDIAKKTGKRPFVVIARFHRKFIDANRAPESAYESEQAKPAYDAYHEALAALRQQVIDRWGSGIVLDIHGQGLERDTIFRGTQDGKTTAHLIERFGKEAQVGEKSLGGLLAKEGLKVVPGVHSHDNEDHYSGGYTVITYGSGSGGTIDAIQLEFGSAHRAVAEIPATSEKLANAIVAFAKNFLPAEEKKAMAQASEKISVGVYIDKGAGPSSNDLLRTLAKNDKVTVTKLTAEQIRSGGLAGLDILMHPGGSGGEQGRNLDEAGREKVRTFVREGGGFVGICAGAYLATAHYPWSLNLLDAKVVDTKHWKRGKGTVDIELTPAGRELLGTPNPKVQIHYANGPLLAPAGRPEIEDYEEMAAFRTELAEHGAPKGVMIGTTAIARGKYGQGRVICFSPHPEMTAGLEHFVQDAIGHVNRKPQEK